MSNSARPTMHVVAGGRDNGMRPVNDGWKADLLLSGNGDSKPTAGNLQLILRNDEALAGSFRYNEFSSRVEVCRPLPGPFALSTGPLMDAHLSALGAWISGSKSYRLNARPPQLAEAVALAAAEHPFHPPREYFDSLEWDGVPRLSRVFSEYLGARESEYEARVALMLYAGLVTRVYRPGCKLDFIVILESLEQGAGKTTWIREMLNPDWCVEPIETMGGREFLMSIRGAAVAELGELSVLSRADFNKVKQAATVQVDTYRDPFARCVASYPRSCVFIGSTNQDDWNRDPTGARRFLPVRVSAVDMAGYLRVRDQLWAEAVSLYMLGFDYWTLPPEAKAEQDERFDDDAWMEPIAHWLNGGAEAKHYPPYLDTRATDRGGGISSVSAANIMLYALGVETAKQDRGQLARVANIMRKIGWGKDRVMRDGVRTVRYRRPEGEINDAPF